MSERIVRWWRRPPNRDTSLRALRDRFYCGVIVFSIVAYPWVDLVRQGSPLVD